MLIVARTKPAAIGLSPPTDWAHVGRKVESPMTASPAMAVAR